jgi:hypothetical protein
MTVWEGTGKSDARGVLYIWSEPFVFVRQSAPVKPEIQAPADTSSETVSPTAEEQAAVREPRTRSTPGTDGPDAGHRPDQTVSR